MIKLTKWFFEKIQEYGIYAVVGFLVGSPRISLNIWNVLAVNTIFLITLFARDRILLTKILNNAQNKSKKVDKCKFILVVCR